MNVASFFEIPVSDLERAADFYGHVFEVELEPVEIDGNRMALFPEHPGPGASGALARGDSYVPSKNGTRLYLSTPDIDRTLARVREKGGRMLYPRTSIGALGFVAEFEDSEGNRIALSSAG